MNDMIFRLVSLKAKGFCCSQIMLIMALEAQGRTNADLVRTVGGLCFGVLISASAKSQLLASQLGMLTSFLPSFLLSGFVFSIANMPAPLRAFTYAVPARYFVSILKGVFLKGIGIRFLALEMGLLSLYAVVVFLLAKRKIRKRIG